MISITGEKVPLSTYSGKVLLLVNVASRCGLTPQYKELQALYEKYKEKGFVILGFPANNFLGQEPGTNDEIKTFCELNYGVSFPLFEKISVKGDDIHPLYKFLTSKKENSVFDAPVKWNFQKFLTDRQGRLVASFGPAVKVTEQIVLEKIRELLGNNQ
jgi:glutathione peroxidase